MLRFYGRSYFLLCRTGVHTWSAYKVLYKPLHSYFHVTFVYISRNIFAEIATDRAAMPNPGKCQGKLPFKKKGKSTSQKRYIMHTQKASRSQSQAHRQTENRIFTDTTISQPSKPDAPFSNAIPCPWAASFVVPSRAKNSELVTTVSLSCNPKCVEHTTKLLSVSLRTTAPFHRFRARTVYLVHNFAF